MSRIHERNLTHLYFESGSSIAYVSYHFIEYIKQEAWTRRQGLPSRLKIRTNNLLTYLDFLLIDEPWDPMDVRLQPYGPFSNDYGATYGRRKEATKRPSPSRKARRSSIDHDAAEVVEATRRELLADFQRDSGIVLMTTSGVDLDKTSPFFGPHVGSDYNMLLKRCLLSLPRPKVLFLDEEKWGFPFLLDNCHAVCDEGFKWVNVRKDTPLAIASAVSSRSQRDKFVASAHANGFTRVECFENKKGVKGVWPVIAANAEFQRLF